MTSYQFLAVIVLIWVRYSDAIKVLDPQWSVFQADAQKLDQKYTNKPLNGPLCSPVFRCYLNSEPFNSWTHLNHLNTELFRYSGSALKWWWILTRAWNMIWIPQLFAELVDTPQHHNPPQRDEVENDWGKSEDCYKNPGHEWNSKFQKCRNAFDRRRCKTDTFLK